MSIDDIQGIKEVTQAELEFIRICEEEELEITRPAREEKERAEAKAREEKELVEAKARRRWKLRLIDTAIRPFRYWGRLPGVLQTIICMFVGAAGVLYPAVFQLVIPIPRKVYPPTSDHYSGWCSKPKGRSSTLQEHGFYYIVDRRFFDQIRRAIERTQDLAEKGPLETLFCHLATKITKGWLMRDEEGWWTAEDEWACPNGQCKYHFEVGCRINRDSTRDDNWAESMSWDPEDWDDHVSRPRYDIKTRIVCLERFRPTSAPSGKFIRRSLLWNDCVCGKGLGDRTCHCLWLRDLPTLDTRGMKTMSDGWQAAETAEAEAKEEQERIRREEDARYMTRVRLYEARRAAEQEKIQSKHRAPPVKTSNYYSLLDAADGE